MKNKLYKKILLLFLTGPLFPVKTGCLLNPYHFMPLKIHL